MISTCGDEERPRISTNRDVEPYLLYPKRLRRFNSGHLKMQVTDLCVGRGPRPFQVVRFDLGHETLQIQRIGSHLHLAILPRPGLVRLVRIEFNPVSFRVGKIQGFAHAVVRESLKAHSTPDQPLKNAGQLITAGIQECRMKKSGRLPRSQFRGCVLFENDQRPSIFRSAQSDGRSFMLLPDEAELAFVKVLSSPEILDRERNAGNVCSGRQQS